MQSKKRIAVIENCLSKTRKPRSVWTLKFRFCGDGDCPDWVLAEIISTLSNFNSSSLESLTAYVAQSIVDADFQEEAIKTLTKNISNEGKSAVACIHFLLINASRHNASEIVFNEEIQQLGLPKELAAGVCRVLSIYVERIKLKLTERSFKINELSSVQFVPTNLAHTSSINFAEFEFCISSELVDGLPEHRKHTLKIERGNMKALLEELKIARTVLENHETKIIASKE